MTTTAVRTIKPSPLDARKRPCAVCGQMTNLRSLCALCREAPVALLATLTQQQDAIIARMASNTEARDKAYTTATQGERLRYQRLCEARKLDNSADFHRRYEATRKLVDGLGAIVRAEIDSSRDEAMLGDLESKIAAVETAIAGLRESEN